VIHWQGSEVENICTCRHAHDGVRMSSGTCGCNPINTLTDAWLRRRNNVRPADRRPGSKLRAKQSPLLAMNRRLRLIVFLLWSYDC
jgi:hypothetical protein